LPSSAVPEIADQQSRRWTSEQYCVPEIAVIA
jgi:hypothetical protein